LCVESFEPVDPFEGSNDTAGELVPVMSHSFHALLIARSSRVDAARRVGTSGGKIDGISTAQGDSCHGFLPSVLAFSPM